MKTLFALVLALSLSASLCLSCASAEEDWTALTPEGWKYIGYTYGGVTFAVPPDYENFGVNEDYKAAGYVLIGGSRDFTLVLRQFQPDQRDYASFKAIITGEKTAECRVRDDNGSEILTYRNTAPGKDSELYGIALTGLDGLFYKISIFTGDSERFDEDAPVWKIAEVIARSVRIQDFSEWGVNAD